jgi:hypothetical protein
MTADTFVARVERGNSDVSRFIAATLPKYEGEVVEIAIKKVRATRSSQANRYYFGVVVKLFAEHCGYDPEDMHEALAMRFLRIEDCPITGAPRRTRTPKCDSHDFAVYVDACIRLALEYGVVIPQPGEA